MLLVQGSTTTRGPVRLPGGRLLGHLSVAARPEAAEDGVRLHEEVAWTPSSGSVMRWQRQSLLRREGEEWIWEAPFLVHPARWKDAEVFSRTLHLRPEAELREAVGLSWMPEIRLVECVAVLPGGAWSVLGRLSFRGLPLGWMALAVVPALAGAGGQDVRI
jgi:hypothetical protein